MRQPLIQCRQCMALLRINLSGTQRLTQTWLEPMSGNGTIQYNQTPLYIQPQQ